ncbi:NAD(P)-dependent oxidoreductase [Roseiconus lacunae]|uniref:NAD(P)-dependent oxidoreductase n=1 Tax=Roseiconus lacunae TaxID=2605694 RepID=UPI001E407F1A|nr:NAD(P)-dependent oxidoreductase [Roseiconus lacunae]
MIRSIERYASKLRELDLEPTCPDVAQNLSEEELIGLLPEFDGWIIGDDPATAEVFDAGVKGNLKAAVKWGVGVDNVDFAGAASAGLTVPNTPGMFGDEVADIAVCYIIGLARQTFQIDAGVKRGEWLKPVGTSLRNKNVAIVGFGDIGRAITRRVLALGMNAFAYDPNPTGVDEFRESVKFLKWPESIASIDFLVLCCALNKETRHFVNRELLSTTKRGLRVVNVARGALIDEEALAEALRDQRVHSAALEVAEVEPMPLGSPLLSFPQCIFGSHNASNTQEAVDRTSDVAIELLASGLRERRCV